VPDLGGGPLEYAATGGARGTRPSTRIRAYRAGYLFGRSGWGGPAESHYTARFGPARYAHGQNDQLSLTYYAGGGNVVVDAGHYGYNDRSWRQWFTSPAAHNTVIPDGAELRPAAPAVLGRSEQQAGADFFALADEGYAGARRDRSVLVAYDPELMVVLDRVRTRTARPVRQLWHLDPRFSATCTSAAAATARAGKAVVHLVSVRLPGDPAPRGGCTAVRGQQRPRQGWVAPRPNTAVPAPVVTMTRTGTDVRLLTLIAPGGVRYRVHTEERGWYRIEADVAGKAVTVRVSPGGSLVRG
jgi:hypothetical protein